MRNNIYTAIIFIIPSVIISGCGSTPQHTNTLLFGTTTKFALDVSVNPAGGTPDFTLGYKRHEGVWMPLLANQQTGESPKPASCTDKDCVFIGTEQIDTYSVLASFGAKFGGGAETITTGDVPGTKVSGNGGLAQFFATGIAAQKLAAAGNSRLVAVQPVDQEQLDDAKARAKKAEDKVENVQNGLIKLLGEKNYSDEVSKGKNQSSLLMARKNIILASVSAGGKLDKAKWDAAVDQSSLEDTIKTNLKSETELDAIDKRLTVDAAMSGATINPLYEAIK